LEASKLPLTSWFLAIQLLTQSKNIVTALELKRHLRVTYRSAWLLKHKILEEIRLAEADRQFTGCVKIDDAYLCGQRSGGKAGRGSENKVPFVAGVQTTEDELPHLICLSPRRFTIRSIEEFLVRQTALPLTLVSDGLCCFEVAACAGAVHDREITCGVKANILNEKFVVANTLIGNVKTALIGTYHAILFTKFAYRYLAEVQFRFNRRYNLRVVLGGLLDALVQAPRRPERGIRVAELHRKSGGQIRRCCRVPDCVFPCTKWFRPEPARAWAWASGAARTARAPKVTNNHVRPHSRPSLKLASSPPCYGQRLLFAASWAQAKQPRRSGQLSALTGCSGLAARSTLLHLDE
jgi:hypothetical protein